eukprot:TRINITY_DN14098_c0_g1_i1.p1 TRINITY_DN14098_c0_g1~~TRINITY_DN14098_c0_g1_i1.p1  ORF type:complete len:209 (+),score=42.63 TRINITY_DN14098_c0_g1_i1:141-767(+)
MPSAPACHAIAQARSSEEEAAFSKKRQDQERLFRRPMPTLAADTMTDQTVEQWNREECTEKGCRVRNCSKWHHTAERRCRMFAVLQNCQDDSGCCKDGLHIKACDVVKDYQIDMQQKEIFELLTMMEGKTKDERAKYIRLVIWNFSMAHIRVAFRFIEKLPLIHEVIFPDMDKTPVNLLVIAKLLEETDGANPRLRVIGFRDGDEERW